MKTYVIYLRRRKKRNNDRWYYYVGQTSRFTGRAKGYLKRYGPTCTVIIIEKIEGTKDLANEREEFWIKEYLERYGEHFENKRGAHSWMGSSFSKKLKKAAADRWEQPEARKKQGERMRRYWARERAKGKKGRCRVDIPRISHPKLSAALRRSWALRKGQNRPVLD